ncbi:hypothetical protein ILYODFUR_036552 [Ilyodon furcidens]|uniref:Uncharacterized protein n=1 Tax=Ilyodon furcidens TaxID=33524 RepID=A0ABV0V147_9TELE
MLRFSKFKFVSFYKNVSRMQTDVRRHSGSSHLDVKGRLGSEVGQGAGDDDAGALKQTSPDYHGAQLTSDDRRITGQNPQIRTHRSSTPSSTRAAFLFIGDG